MARPNLTQILGETTTAAAGAEGVGVEVRSP